MSMRAAFVAVVMLAGCAAGPDASALVGGQGFEPEIEETGSTADALSSSAKTWFPMGEGNTWSLRSTTTNSVKSVSMQAYQDGVAWLDGLSPDGAWIGVASSAPNTLYQWDETKGWGVYIRFGYAVTPWKSGPGTTGCGSFNVRRSGTDLTVVTAAGTFTQARSISFEQIGGPTVRCAPPAVKEVTFAPGVGLVALRTGTDEFFTLTSATVGGKKIPSAPVGVVTGKLTTDKLSYESKPNTIRCITQPCPTNDVTAVARFSYTVTNGTASSVTWQFSTGCQFDIEIADATGRVLRRASDGRNCTFALTSMTLRAGESRTYTQDIELKETEGYLQLEGRLSAKASLIPRLASPGATGSTDFSVKIVN